MTSKERIKNCLNFKKPDRIGIYDVILEETIEKWETQRLPHQQKIQAYFDYDFEIIYLEKQAKSQIDNTKFVCLSVSEPFSKACNEYGLETTLKNMAYEPRRMANVFGNITEDILKKTTSIIEKSFSFDGVWLAGDLAYERGLFFSLGLYKTLIFPLHKELCKFFKSKKLDIIFHSHGDIKKIIPILIELGVNAIEPLETNSGLDALELRKAYKKEIALFGNISFDNLKTSRQAFKNEVEKKIAFLKEDSGYIYRMDKDITPDIAFDDYKFAIETVKQYGAY